LKERVDFVEALASEVAQKPSGFVCLKEGNDLKIFPVTREVCGSYKSSSI